MTKGMVERIMEDMAHELTLGREIVTIHLSRDYWILIHKELVPYTEKFADGQPNKILGIHVNFVMEPTQHQPDFGYSVESYLTRGGTY